MKIELNNLEKSNFEKTNKLDHYDKEIARFKEIENYLSVNIHDTKKELDNVRNFFII